MGIMAIPFDTIKRAKLFAKCMQKPWIAKVKADKEEPGYYVWTFSPRALVGSDNLFDVFDQKCKKKKDFDIRPYVKKAVRSWLEYDVDPRGSDNPLEAVNIVRQAVGLKPLIEKSLDKKSAPITKLKSHGYRIRKYEIMEVSKLSNFAKKLYNVEKFAGLKDNYYIYEVCFASERKLEDLKKVLKEDFSVEGVRKISPYRVNDRIIIIKYTKK